MARIRTIKPEFWQDEKLSPLRPIDRLVFLGLVSLADDKGRLIDNPRMLDGLLFPETKDTCEESLEILARLARIIRYRSKSGQRIIQVAKWEDHQRVDKPSKHNLPGPSESDLKALAAQQDTASSLDPREILATVSGDALAPTLDRGPTTMDLSADKSAGAEAPVEESPDSEPPQPWNTLLAPLVKKHLWLGEEPPEAGHDMANDLSICKRILSDEDMDAADLASCIEVARSALDLPNGRPFDMRLFYVKGRRDRLNVCRGAVQKKGGTKTAGQVLQQIGLRATG